MELETWQEGLKLCKENIVRLRDDALLLMNHESYGHAYFSLYTAMEELWKAYLIIENFYNVNTEAFLKHLKHHSFKRPYPIYRVFFDDISKLYIDDLWEFTKFSEEISKSLSKYHNQIALESEDMIYTTEYKYGKELDNYLGIWKKRNRIYLSLNEEENDWVTYKDIKREELDDFYKKLDKAIEVIDRFITNLFTYRDNPIF